MEDAGGKFAHHQLIPVGLLQGGDQQPGFHRPVVDEKGLQAPAGPGLGGLGDVAGELIAVPFALHRGHVRELPAIDAVYRRLQGAASRGGEHLLAVPEEGDGHLGMGQGLELHRRRDPAALHGIGFHELHPGGGVVKQIPNDDGGALGTAGFAFLGDDTGLQMQRGAGNAPGGLGHQIDAADGGDGGQRLPPEAHGGDGGQILGGAELGGGVAEEGGAGVLGCHAAAVIRHPQKGHAPVPDFHGDLGGTGIHGVLQQLLDHAGGPLHHLTGGNQIGNMGRQLNDGRHKITSEK